MGACLAHSRAALDQRRIVPGGVLGRIVAGLAVPRSRDRARFVRAGIALGDLAAGLVPMAKPRAGAEPSRPRLGPVASPGDHPDRYVELAGSGLARAVAGAARAHAGVAETDSRRLATAALAHP